jgi:hypothetical protein
VLDSVNKILIPGMETYYEINPRYSLDFVENIKTEEKNLSYWPSNLSKQEKNQ